MNSKAYAPEVMEQIGKIYDKLDRLPEDKRSIVMLMVEAFISGMSAQERLVADQNSA